MKNEIRFEDNQSLIIFLSLFYRSQNDEPDKKTKSGPSFKGKLW